MASSTQPKGRSKKNKKPDKAKRSKQRKIRLLAMPKRPLTAYNVFFRAEHQRMLRLGTPLAANNRFEEDTSATSPSAQLVTCIAAKWKSLPADERLKCYEISRLDNERYDIEIKLWREQESEQQEIMIEEAKQQCKGWVWPTGTSKEQTKKRSNSVRRSDLASSQNGVDQQMIAPGNQPQCASQAQELKDHDNQAFGFASTGWKNQFSKGQNSQQGQRLGETCHFESWQQSLPPSFLAPTNLGLSLFRGLVLTDGNDSLTGLSNFDGGLGCLDQDQPASDPASLQTDLSFTTAGSGGGSFSSAYGNQVTYGLEDAVAQLDSQTLVLASNVNDSDKRHACDFGGATLKADRSGPNGASYSVFDSFQYGGAYSLWPTYNVSTESASLRLLMSELDEEDQVFIASLRD